jgi:hypothetical protein
MSEFKTEYPFDFNEVGAAQSELIPAGTVVNVRLLIKNGGFGPDGILAKSRGTGILYLNTMLIVIEGPYALRKITHRFGVQAYEPGNEWVEKGLIQLRAILESARNVSSADESEAAKEKRRVASYKDFDGLEFLIKVGVEVPKNPQYKTENRVLCVVTPDMKEYLERKATQGLQAAWPLLRRG